MSNAINNAEIREASELFENGMYEQAFVRYKALAEKGSVDSQVFLGWMYQQGKGTMRDLGQAKKWYEKAASLGAPEGHFYLAKLAYKDKNFQKAKELFEKSADRGHSPSLFRLGLMYELGRGVSPDIEKACAYYEKSAKLGNVFGEKYLAVLLLKGNKGFLGRFVGLWLFVRALLNTVIVGLKDVESDRLRD